MLNVQDVGHRVVVRRVIGERDGRPLFSDVLGELVTWGDPTVLCTADGAHVSVPLAAIASAKRVPPRAERARHRSIAPMELERIAAQGWRGTEETTIDGWLVRAGGGWTGRANSALPLADLDASPDAQLDDTLARISAWYADRGLPLVVQLPLPVRSSLYDALLERGWTDSYGALVKTASCAAVLAAVPPNAALPPATLDEEPTTNWLAMYHYRGGALPEVARRVLGTGTAPIFASVVEHGHVRAVARGALEERWLGISAVEVDPTQRRRGLGTHLLRELVAHAAAQGTHSVFLQVEDTNLGAQALYDAVGFATHHTYRYLRAPLSA